MRNVAVRAGVRPLRVLIADDDPIARSLIRTKIGSLATEIVEASDGVRAWQLLETESFQLALVDLEMPNINGFTLIQCVRAHPHTRHMPIVVVTCREDQAAIQRALEAGASSYLVKPLTWSMFQAHIEHLLRLSANAQAADIALKQERRFASARRKLSTAVNDNLRMQSAELRKRVALGIPSEPKADEADVASRPGVGADLDALEAAAERYSRALDVLDRAAADEGPNRRLQDLLQKALGAVEVCAPRCLDVKIMQDDDVVVCGGHDALSFALPEVLRVLAARSTGDTSIVVDAKMSDDGLRLSFAASGPPLPDSIRRKYDTDLTRASDPHVADFALGRVLVEALGGTLEFDSKPASGHLVWLQLPPDRICLAATQ